MSKQQQFGDIEQLIEQMVEKRVKEILASKETDKKVIIDNNTGEEIQKALTKQFGDKSFRVKMKNFLVPFVSPSRYKYVIESVEWTLGPNPYQVFFFIKENFKYNLQSQEFRGSLLNRKIPDIEKRFLSFYRPVDIAGVSFDPIEIFVTKAVNKKDGKVVDVTFFLEIMEDWRTDEEKKKGEPPKLRFIEGNSLDDVLYKLQSEIERIFYLPSYDRRNQQLMKKEKKSLLANTVNSKNVMSQEQDPDLTGQDVQDSSVADEESYQEPSEVTQEEEDSQPSTEDDNSSNDDQ